MRTMNKSEISRVVRELENLTGVTGWESMTDDEIMAVLRDHNLAFSDWPDFYLDILRGQVTPDFEIIGENGSTGIV